MKQQTAFFGCYLPIGYVNEKNVVALETDSPNPIPSCCPPGSWPDHYFGLELCSSYVYLATQLVRQTGLSQIPFRVLAEVSFPFPSW